jgi:hypothetical protein
VLDDEFLVLILVLRLKQVMVNDILGVEKLVLWDDDELVMMAVAEVVVVAVVLVLVLVSIMHLYTNATTRIVFILRIVTYLI